MMTAGQRLYPDTEIRANGAALRYQSDGNLVLYVRSGPRWSSATSGHVAGYVELQGDGNLVVYGADGTPYWATNTQADRPELHISPNGLRLTGGALVWSVTLDEEPTPDPGTLPAFLAERKIGDQLRCDGESFFSGVDVALPVGCHAGDLLGQWAVLPAKRDAILRALDAMYAAGYAFLRCWANIPPNPWWSTKPAPAWGIFETPGFDAHYASFLAELRERGLRLHLAPGGLDRYSRDQRRTFYRWIHDRVADGPSDYCLVEGVNEAGATGAAHLREEIEHEFIKPIVDRTGVLGALSGYGGTEDRPILRAWTPAWMRFVYYHSYRKRDFLADIIRHHFSFVREDRVRRLAWSGEPTGHYFPLVTDGFSSTSAAGVGMLHVQTAMCRTVPCFMSSSGVIFDQPFEAMPGFATTPTAVARLPKDVHRFALTHGGSGDAWVGAVGAGADLVRVDQAFNFDGQFVATVYGERDRAVDLPLAGLALAGTWFNGEGQAIADQSPGRAFRAPTTHPGCYFVGRRA